MPPGEEKNSKSPNNQTGGGLLNTANFSKQADNAKNGGPTGPSQSPNAEASEVKVAIK